MFTDTSITLALLLIGITGFLLLFGGSGGYVLFLSLSDRKKASATKNWPSVPGKIVASHIQEVTHQTSDGPQSYLRLEAEYVYTVGGRTYFNDKHVPGRVPKSIPFQKQTDAANRYAEGAIVPVYYNPQNPQDACLEREAPLSNLTLAIAIVLLSIAACGACVFGILLINAIRIAISG